jgi:hypothetical protein
VGGNRVVNVPTIPDLHLLGESCIFKHRIPGECSSVASSIKFLTHKFDKSQSRKHKTANAAQGQLKQLGA